MAELQMHKNERFSVQTLSKFGYWFIFIFRLIYKMELEEKSNYLDIKVLSDRRTILVCLVM